MRNVTNPAHGRAFENLLAHQARRLDLWLISNGTKLKYLPGGKTLAVRSDLDFRLVNRQGQQMVFDAKSVAGDHFVYSFLTPHQVLRAKEYARWKVRAGFVVHLREIRTIVYYDIQTIERAGPRSRFTAQDGRILGPDSHFALSLVFA